MRNRIELVIKFMPGVSRSTFVQSHSFYQSHMISIFNYALGPDKVPAKKIRFTVNLRAYLSRDSP